MYAAVVYMSFICMWIAEALWASVGGLLAIVITCSLYECLPKGLTMKAAAQVV